MTTVPDDAAHPDRRALARIGAAVRQRLDHSPAAWRYPVDRAEIYGIAGFLDAATCAHLVALIDEAAAPSALACDREWPGYRTSCSGDIDTRHHAVRELEARLAALTGLAAARGEAAQGQRYECGQYFHEHCDWFDTASAYWPHEQRSGGQRSWTAMLYLNGVEEGGLTDFTRLALRVKPAAGALLLWNNALPDGRPNPWTMHAARPVERGVKYVVTKWFRTRTWQ